ncbi:uncharacterized protein N7482_009232 [Penicillium canariense]|uniref:Protein kinase domain-containing protein n=1 Tax=Penicillium canariense TaxID=189055 RepID=A0A9W9LFI8_9EURO|nr:uncharacterized protein N7482_009232 [Penicillium canariense]KAJ5152754.1 hypothetical protein N7482_009232 [Penicillium canariense]
MLLPVVAFEDTMSTFIQKGQFTSVARDIEACQVDESVVLTELIISNQICKYLLARQPLLIILAEAYFNASRSLKAVLYANSKLDTIEKGWPLLQVDELEGLLDRVKRAPMSYAAEEGHEGVVRLLVEKGADIEARDTSGRTALSWAAEKGHENIVRLLLEKGVDIEARDILDRTPLLWAIKERHENIVKLLLEKGAELEARNFPGRNPLSLAAEKGYENIVKLLLEKGADIEARDILDRTLLLWAVEEQHENIVKLLLEKGADIEARDISDRTPLSWAAEKGHEGIFKLLLEKDADNKAKDNEEVRTSRGNVKDSLLSPLYITSPTQSSTSLEDRSAAGSGDRIIPFGSKYRRSTTRNVSRRPTTSSEKSPASAFLSMWSSNEPVASPDDEGQMVGKDYVLGPQIACGGLSVVKKANKVEEDGTTKRLAVKIFRKNITGRSERENEEVQAELDHEIQVWRYLDHPHVLTLDAVYETDFATFCFMKLANSGTLFDLVLRNRQGLDITLAKQYSYQLACAIRYLHEYARVVHRDIKLENCLLDLTDTNSTTSSTLVLCDFGMAEWLASNDGGESSDPYNEVVGRSPPKQIGLTNTSTASVAGSLEYASPELLESLNGVIHPSVDIWAFGVVVYTMIVGSRPFQNSFAPRIRSNILSGRWNREAMLSGIKDEMLRKDRQDALDLVIGCLEIEVNKRWTIRDILASPWLREAAKSAGGSSPESPRKSTHSREL